MKSIIPSEEVNAIQDETSDWNDIPTWAVGLIEYRDGGRYWISNDGLRLEEVNCQRPKEIQDE